MSLTDQPGAGSAPWVVLKFGGTSVSSRARWDTIGALAQKRRAEGLRVLVVVSALSGVTNALVEMTQSGADGAVLQAQAEALAQRHREFAAILGLDAEAVVGDLLAQLQALACDMRALHSGLDWQAEVLAMGELFSSRLGSAYLSRTRLEVGWSDARQYLRAVQLPNQSEWAQRLSANCDTEAQPGFAKHYAAQGDCLITQGFICADAQGRTTILGRGGSDTSAAYFGALLGAARVEIWTDVPGMFSANPRQVPQARLLTRLDYEEAQEIATTGAKVLHPRCISPCQKARVPLWIRDTSRPDYEGTVIGPRKADGVPGVKAISSRQGIVLVSMDGIGMWQQVGFLADVFERFKRHGLSVDLISSSEANVTVSLDPSDNLVNSDVLERLCNDLAEVCRVKVIAPCAAITLVGRGMRSLLHRLSEVLAEFGRERVHLISQSSNDLNLTFVLDEAVADGMLPRLHALLIQAGAMPVSEAAVFGPSWTRLEKPVHTPVLPWWQARRDALLRLAGQGTPRQVLDLAWLRRQARALRGLDVVDRHFHAVSMQPDPRVLQVLEAEGWGFDCVSADELETLFALFPRLDLTRVRFAPGLAARAEYEAAIGRDVWLMLDSACPLQQWPELFAGRDLCLRLAPDLHRTRPGVGLNEIEAVAEAARQAGARLFGLHLALGPDAVDAGRWREALAQLAASSETLGTVAALSVSGGLGHSGDERVEALDLALLESLLIEFKQLCPRHAVWMEQGRWLLTEAGIALLQVTQARDRGLSRRVGVDGRLPDGLHSASRAMRHEWINLSRFGVSADRICEVLGSASSDVAAWPCRLPAPQPGDVLLLTQTGAGEQRLSAPQVFIDDQPDQEAEHG